MSGEEKKELKVLVVEDTEEHLILIMEALKKSSMNIRAFAAINGQEALDFLYNRGKFSSTSDYPRPDVVVLDLRLPKVDGIEVLERIRGDERLKDLPVVVLTSSKRDEDILKSIGLGAKGYLLKSSTFIVEKTANMEKLLDTLLLLA